MLSVENKPKNRFIIFFIDVYENLLIFARYVRAKALHIQQQDAVIRSEDTFEKFTRLQDPGHVRCEPGYGFAVLLDIFFCA